MTDTQLIKANGKCAPSCKFKDDVCLDTNEMKTILNLAKDSKGIVKKIPNKRSELVSEIKQIVSDNCKDNMDDFCLINKLIKEIPNYEEKKKLEEIKNKRYLALKPKSWEQNPTEWLSNFDIDKVMKQYEIAYKKFKYLGCYPIDFMDKYSNTNQCITNMCDFDISKYDKHTEFGMILNLDKHNQSGSHWVAIYINKNVKDSKYGCFYYDSGGILPSNRIINFFKLVKSQLHNDKHFHGFYNKTRHQYKNTECGMYSMCFIILCLENKSKTYEEVLAKIEPKSDNFINLHRNKLYLSI